MAILNFDGGFFSFAKGVSGRSENKAAAFPLQYGAARLDLKCLCSASDAFLLARTRRFARKEVRPSHIVTFSFFFLLLAQNSLTCQKPPQLLLPQEAPAWLLQAEMLGGGSPCHQPQLGLFSLEQAKATGGGEYN